MYMYIGSTKHFLAWSTYQNVLSIFFVFVFCLNQLMCGYMHAYSIPNLELLNLGYFKVTMTFTFIKFQWIGTKILIIYMQSVVLNFVIIKMFWLLCFLVGLHQVFLNSGNLQETSNWSFYLVYRSIVLILLTVWRTISSNTLSYLSTVYLLLTIIMSPTS